MKYLDLELQIRVSESGVAKSPKICTILPGDAGSYCGGGLDGGSGRGR